MTKHLYDRVSGGARYEMSKWIEACAKCRTELFAECLNEEHMPYIWKLAEKAPWPTEEDERRVLEEDLAAHEAGHGNCLPEMFGDFWCNEVAGLLGLKCKGG